MEELLPTLVIIGIPLLLVIIGYAIWNAGHRAGEGTAYYHKVTEYDEDGRVTQVTYEVRDD
jgi:TM2 domain-containing membrane protein YozV